MELTGKVTTNASGTSVQGLDTFQQISSEVFMTMMPENLERDIEAINSGAIEKLNNATDHWRGMGVFNPH